MLKRHYLSVSHLSEHPWYYLVSKSIDGQEYYFVTQFFDDLEGCGGNCRTEEEGWEITTQITEGENLSDVDQADSEYQGFFNSLERPDLASKRLTKPLS